MRPPLRPLGAHPRRAVFSAHDHFFPEVVAEAAQLRLPRREPAPSAPEVRDLPQGPAAAETELTFASPQRLRRREDGG